MKNRYFLFLLLLASACAAQAQTAGQYFFKAKSGVVLEDISSGATALLAQNADMAVSSQVGLPFSFVFAGTSYNSFSVSEDGLVVLGNATYTPYPYDNYFAQSYALPPITIAPVYPILLPWGEDLTTGANGGVAYKVTGASPNRKAVIEFKVNSAEDNTGAYLVNYNKTFQVWLFEGTNQIQFVYGNIAADWYTSANIGMAASASDYLSVDVAAATASAVTVSGNSGIYPNRAPVPVAGTSYIFSPTAISEPPAPQPAPAPVPVTASVVVLPEYTVAGQQRRTIYLGYGLQTVLLYANASGGNPPASGFTYSWSPATGLSDATAAWPLASPKVTTTYTVTISDGNGNQTTQAVTINVIDVRCGEKGDKVTVSKYDNKGVCKASCFNVKEVDDHLKKGETLGGCSALASTARTSITAVAGAENISMQEIAATLPGPVVFPVPTSGRFTIQLPEAKFASLITIYNTNGKMVAKKQATENQRTFEWDLTGQAPGVYLIKMTGKEGMRTGKIIIQ